MVPLCAERRRANKTPPVIKKKHGQRRHVRDQARWKAVNRLAESPRQERDLHQRPTYTQRPPPPPPLSATTTPSHHPNSSRTCRLGAAAAAGTAQRCRRAAARRGPPTAMGPAQPRRTRPAAAERRRRPSTLDEGSAMDDGDGERCASTRGVRVGSRWVVRTGFVLPSSKTLTMLSRSSNSRPTLIGRLGVGCPNGG